jgi:hypothetical protein
MKTLFFAIRRHSKEWRRIASAAHLDILQQALTAVLAIGRRDGALPIAGGVKPVRSYGVRA